MQQQYTSTGTLQNQRVMHPAGSIVPITDAAEIKRLLAIGAIVKADGAAVAPAAPSVFDASASVKKLTPQIEGSTDATALMALREAELAREGGARSSIIGAIDARIEELAAAGADDDEVEDEDEPQ